MPLPWSGELAGRIDEHVITSAALAATRSATPSSGPCGCTCRRATTTAADRLPSIYVIQGYTGYLTMWANRDAYHQPFPETADAVVRLGPGAAVHRGVGGRLDGVRGLAVRGLAGDGAVPLLSV